MQVYFEGVYASIHTDTPVVKLNIAGYFVVINVVINTFATE